MRLKRVTTAVVAAAALAVGMSSPAYAVAEATYEWTGIGSAAGGVGGQTLTAFNVSASSDTCASVAAIPPATIEIVGCSASISVPMLGNGTTCSGVGVGVLSVAPTGSGPSINYTVAMQMSGGVGVFTGLGQSVPLLTFGKADGHIAVNCVERTLLAWHGVAQVARV